MTLDALRGALGFLSRLPVGRTEAAWDAFRTTPAALPAAGYLLGGLLAVPTAGAVALGLPAPTVAFVLLVAVVALTGVNHADGVADIGDAAVVHGDAEHRRSVMADTTVGVGAVLALGVALAGLALAGLALPALGPLRTAGLVVAAEVGAKVAVAALVTLGEPAHEGMGAAAVGEADPRDLLVPLALALPAAAATAVAGSLGAGPSVSVEGTALAAAPAGALVAPVALSTALVVALSLRRWSRRRLGGVSGDVLGAANDLARVAALHAGVVAWTLS